jgi:hypothetical protein
MIFQKLCKSVGTVVKINFIYSFFFSSAHLNINFSQSKQNLDTVLKKKLGIVSTDKAKVLHFTVLLYVTLNTLYLTKHSSLNEFLKKNSGSFLVLTKRNYCILWYCCTC